MFAILYFSLVFSPYVQCFESDKNRNFYENIEPCFEMLIDFEISALFSRPTDIHSHRTRLVLAEKNINIEIANVAGPDLPEDLMDLNPYIRYRPWSIVT